MTQNTLEHAVTLSQTAQKQLLDSERSQQQQAAALFQLTQDKAISKGHLEQAFSIITEVTAAVLQTDRASIWLSDQQGTKVQCADLFQKIEQTHSSGLELKAADYPAYFAAVMSAPMLAAHDAMNDPRTAEFSKGYLDIFNIASMLDASIYVDGQMRGVICCEHVGKMRTWQTSEQTFIRSIANIVALTLEANQRHQKTEKLEEALSLLEHSQLRVIQSEKMASLGNLVSGIAHEINNPIGFLKGSIKNTQTYCQDICNHLELYKQHYPDVPQDIQDNAEDIDLDFLLEDFPKMLASMKAANQRIQSISNSLRTFSRADTEHKVSASLNEGLDSTLLILKYRLKDTDNRPAIKIVKEYGELSNIDCFPGQLNQVFMNILANAIDIFDEAAEQTTFQELRKSPQVITVRTQLCTEPKAIKISIRDNGKGMPAEVSAKIFDRLFTTKGVGRGTGLGLAISQQIVVDAHGGQLSVQSEIGKGTEFHIQLPFSAEVAPPRT